MVSLSHPQSPHFYLQEDDTMVNLAVALEKEGITAFRFDISGCGESEGSSHFGNYRSEAEDLRAVIHHFNGANRIMSAILGHSKRQCLLSKS